MAAANASGKKLLRDATMEELNDIFMRSCKLASDNAERAFSDTRKNLSNDDVEKEVILNAMRQQMIISKVSAANVDDVRFFCASLCKSEVEVAAIFSFLSKNDLSFTDIGANMRASDREISKAASDGHNLCIKLRQEMGANNTIVTDLGQVRMLAKRATIINKLWAELRNENLRKTEEKGGSMVSELQTHILMNGNLDNPPFVCYERGADGIFYFAKLMAAKAAGQNIYIEDEHYKQLNKAMSGHVDYPTMVTQAKTFTVDVSGGGRDEILFKRNSMTMDYAMLFWIMLYRSKLSAREAFSVLTTVNDLALKSNSDKRVENYIKFKAHGSAGKRQSGNAKEHPGFLKIEQFVTFLGTRTKKLQDNPFFLCKSVVYELLKIAGMFPLAVSSGSFFGSHQLYGIKNILLNDFSGRDVENFLAWLDGSGNAKSHIVHRGIVGTLFCNISRVKEETLTITVVGQ